MRACRGWNELEFPITADGASMINGLVINSPFLMEHKISLRGYWWRRVEG